MSDSSSRQGRAPRDVILKRVKQGTPSRNRLTEVSTQGRDFYSCRTPAQCDSSSPAQDFQVVPKLDSDNSASRPVPFPVLQKRLGTATACGPALSVTRQMDPSPVSQFVGAVRAELSMEEMLCRQEEQLQRLKDSTRAADAAIALRRFKAASEKAVAAAHWKAEHESRLNQPSHKLSFISHSLCSVEEDAASSSHLQQARAPRDSHRTTVGMNHYSTIKLKAKSLQDTLAEVRLKFTGQPWQSVSEKCWIPPEPESESCIISELDTEALERMLFTAVSRATDAEHADESSLSASSEESSFASSSSSHTSACAVEIEDAREASTCNAESVADESFRDVETQFEVAESKRMNKSLEDALDIAQTQTGAMHTHRETSTTNPTNTHVVLYAAVACACASVFARKFG